MAKDKLNNLLGMDDYKEKDFFKSSKATKRTEVAKDILNEDTGKNVFSEKIKGKEEIKSKELHNLISLDGFGEKALPKKNIKATKRTDVGKDVLHENTGKDVFAEKPKSKEDVVYKKLHNLCCIDEFTEKEVMKDAKKTKRTDVAKDVLLEKRKAAKKPCKCECDDDDDDEKETKKDKDCITAKQAKANFPWNKGKKVCK